MRFPFQDPTQPPDDDPFSQEDDETRARIARYLRLADRLLATDHNQEEDEGSAA